MTRKITTLALVASLASAGMASASHPLLCTSLFDGIADVFDIDCPTIDPASSDRPESDRTTDRTRDDRPTDRDQVGQPPIGPPVPVDENEIDFVVDGADTTRVDG